MSNLKQIRESRGLSQNQLAKLADINPQMLKFYEQGVRDINGAKAITVYKLATALQVGVEDLLNID